MLYYNDSLGWVDDEQYPRNTSGQSLADPRFDNSGNTSAGVTNPNDTSMWDYQQAQNTGFIYTPEQLGWDAASAQRLRDAGIDKLPEWFAKQLIMSSAFHLGNRDPIQNYIDLNNTPVEQAMGQWDSSKRAAQELSGYGATGFDTDPAAKEAYMRQAFSNMNNAKDSWWDRNQGWVIGGGGLLSVGGLGALGEAGLLGAGAAGAGAGGAEAGAAGTGAGGSWLGALEGGVGAYGAGGAGAAGELGPVFGGAGGMTVGGIGTGAGSVAEAGTGAGGLYGTSATIGGGGVGGGGGGGLFGTGVGGSTALGASGAGSAASGGGGLLSNLFTSGGGAMGNWWDSLIGVGGAVAGGILGWDAQQDALKEAGNQTDKSIAFQKYMYDEALKNYAPFRDLGVSKIGELSTMDPTGGAGQYTEALKNYGTNFKFNEQDPVYQQKLKLAETANDRQLSARGMYNSRAGLNLQTDTAQNIQSNEFEKQYSRGYTNLMDLFNMSSKSGATNYNKLLDLTKIGAGAASTAGNAALNLGQGVSSAYGNLAAQDIASGQSTANLMSGLGAMPMNYMILQQMLNGGK